MPCLKVSSPGAVDGATEFNGSTKLGLKTGCPQNQKFIIYHSVAGEKPSKMTLLPVN
jgi:hypothetical protein